MPIIKKVGIKVSVLPIANHTFVLYFVELFRYKCILINIKVRYSYHRFLSSFEAFIYREGEIFLAPTCFRYVYQACPDLYFPDTGRIQYFCGFIPYGVIWKPPLTNQIMVYISRKEHFNAAHRLFNPNWTDERNKEVFGPCANHNWHGHNFELIVTVKGEPDPDTGFVIDLKVLGDVIKRDVIEALDHKNINLDVPFMQGKMASCEILVMEIWKILDAALQPLTEARLYQIRLYETERNFVDYYGE